jgi:sporulation protein YlmC with PRC-barrel domain
VPNDSAARREVALELLLGRRVRDADGVSLGRLQEVVAEHEGGDLLVRAFLVGRHALAERFGGGRLLNALARLVTRDRGFEGLIVPWHAMDLGDPSRPRCTLRRDEIRRLTAERERSGGGVATGR